MATNHLTSSDNVDEEDYIDIEVSTTSSSPLIFFPNSTTSPPFEFKMSSSISPHNKETQPTTSPADELFYKGNLLPLHLPPRLQMVQNLQEHPNTSNYTTSFTPSTTSTTTCTPFESCNISPSESCRVSKELTPDEYFSEFSMELRRFIEEEEISPKRLSWSNKIKNSSLAMKVKSSKAYFRSLFNKSGCSNESCTQATSLKAKIGAKKSTPFGHVHRVRSGDKHKVIGDGCDSHRRSFSGAIHRCLATKCSCSSCSSSEGSGSSSSTSSSSFSSGNSNGFYELHLLRRSGSANSEIECSIQGAIAHCKQSQQVEKSRMSVSEVGFCSLSVCQDQERSVLSRG